MKPISSAIVERTWKELGSMSPEAIPKIVQLMQEQQPFVLVYLLTIGDDILNEDERELLLYLGMVIWQIMLQGDTPLTKVTAADLDKAEEANMKMLKYLEGESEASLMDTVERMLSSYGQPEVLKYVVEALMEEPEEGCLIRDKNKGIMMIYLKTVLDCFNR